MVSFSGNSPKLSVHKCGIHLPFIDMKTKNRHFKCDFAIQCNPFRWNLWFNICHLNESAQVKIGSVSILYKSFMFNNSINLHSMYFCWGATKAAISKSECNNCHNWQSKMKEEKIIAKQRKKKKAEKEKNNKLYCSMKECYMYFVLFDGVCHFSSHYNSGAYSCVCVSANVKWTEEREREREPCTLTNCSMWKRKNELAGSCANGVIVCVEIV